MTGLAVTDNVKSAVTDPHRRKDFLDPTEIKTFPRGGEGWKTRRTRSLALPDDVPARFAL
jgi:hypothetical protein